MARVRGDYAITKSRGATVVRLGLCALLINDDMAAYRVRSALCTLEEFPDALRRVTPGRSMHHQVFNAISLSRHGILEVVDLKCYIQPTIRVKLIYHL